MYGDPTVVLRLLLLLVVVCGCVVEDSREGEHNWTAVVQRAGERNGLLKYSKKI